MNLPDFDLAHDGWVYLNKEEYLLNAYDFETFMLERKLIFMDVPLQKKLYEKDTQFK